MEKNLDIIWNISLVCPWDCEICCVDAIHVAKRNLYNLTTKIRQKQGKELTLKQKLDVLQNLQDHNVSINFSGGDPLVVSENLVVIIRASEIYGRQNIQVSTTGAGLSMYDPDFIALFINKLKFTYDTAWGIYDPNRPRKYNDSNLKKASAYVNAGIITTAEVPLSIRNTDANIITSIYQNLNRANIDQILIMRLFPVGRGLNKKQEIPNKDQYLRAIEIFRKLEAKYKKPKVRLQCALKHLYASETDDNPCDLYEKSFAITPDGSLTVSAWALGFKPMHEVFVLGDIAKEHIDTILNSDKSKYYYGVLGNNFGHCKMFAYLHSTKSEPIERLTDVADPLYV